MNNFLDRLEKASPKSEELALSWLGQAGFLIKTAKGKLVLIDPYLSDYTNRILCNEHGQAFRRMTAPLFDPRQIKADKLFISHEHPDHCDIDSLPSLLANPDLACYMNLDTIMEVQKNGFCADKILEIKKGDTWNFEEFRFIVTDCDHGTQSPGAMGFIFDFGFVSVYYSGDTSYNKERLDTVISGKVDVALLPINGAFGNMNALEAACLANDLEAKLCIPHHFWTFPAHDGPLGSPKDAIESFPKCAPGCELWLGTPGDFLFIGKNGAFQI